MGGSQSNSFRAWAEPKAARRRLVNTMLQMPANFILCFRAQEKAKPEKGSKELKDLGWMPIAGDQWTYECTAMALLLPGANGVPTWVPERPGEKRMVKMPEQFKSIFAKPQALNEEIGAQLARWAAGDTVAVPAAKPAIDVTAMLDGYDAAGSLEEIARLEKDRAAVWKQISKDDQAALKDAASKARARLGTQKEA